MIIVYVNHKYYNNVLGDPEAKLFEEDQEDEQHKSSTNPILKSID